jgi:hypothetical protein
LNVTPQTLCYICGGAGKGEGFKPSNLKPLLLLGDVRNNTLNINCNINDYCNLYGGLTSSATVSRNTVNVYAVSPSTEVVIYGGYVFDLGCAENNTVNIYKDFSCESVFGGLVSNGTSSFNTVNVFSNLNISRGFDGGVSGGRVTTNNGISMNNSVNVYGSITAQGEVNIFGGDAYVAGSANDNRVNISGTIESKGDLSIYG